MKNLKDVYAGKTGYVALTPSKTMYATVGTGPLDMPDGEHKESLLKCGAVTDKKDMGAAPENKMMKTPVENKVVTVDENKDEISMVDMDDESFKDLYLDKVGKKLHHMKSRKNAIKEINGE